MMSPGDRLRVAAILAALFLGSVTAGGAGDISLRFDRIPVTDLLPLIADHYGLDLVVAGEPAGVVSVDLRDRTLDEVLGEVLLGTGFTHLVSNRTIRIVPGDAMVSRTYHLDYLEAVATSEAAANILADAEIAPDAASNTVTLVGSAYDARHLEDMFREADTPPRQVDIRSRMVEVNVTSLENLGIDWFFRWNDDIQDARATTVVNNAAVPNLRLAYSRLTTWQADAVLQAIMNDTDSRIIASPHISTANNQTSKILVGERVPYTRLTVETVSGAVQEEVDFVDVGVQLEVTPLIASDSIVIMTVSAEISEVLDQEVQGIPRIGTREAHTRVAAGTGETLVIGGLRKHSEIQSVSGVPIVGRIPFLGRLFRYESVQQLETEVLIFLMPTIVGTESTRIEFSDRLIEEHETRLGDGQSP